MRDRNIDLWSKLLSPVVDGRNAAVPHESHPDVFDVLEVMKVGERSVSAVFSSPCVIFFSRLGRRKSPIQEPSAHTFCAPHPNMNE